MSGDDDDFDLDDDLSDDDLSDDDLSDNDLSDDDLSDDDLESESTGVDDDFDFDAYESQSTGDESDEGLDEGEYESDEDFGEEDDFEDFEDEEDFDDFDEEEDFESDSAAGGDASDDDDISLEIEDDSEDDLSDEDDEMESESMELNLNLLEAVSAGNGGVLDPKQLHVANCGSVNGVGTWTAFYNGTPVALAKANNVPDSVVGIFDKPAFHAAVTTGAKTDGVLATLSNMGFEAIVPDLDINCVVEHSIVAEAQAKVDEMSANLEQREKDLSDRLQSAISISFAGINRNFFKGVSNPLRSKLIGSLSAAGLQNPEKLVDSCLAESSDLMASTVIKQAMSIASRSPEGQNELAEAISSVNPGVAVDNISDIGSVVESTQSSKTQQQSLSSESSAPRVNPLKHLLKY